MLLLLMISVNSCVLCKCILICLRCVDPMLFTMHLFNSVLYQVTFLGLRDIHHLFFHLDLVDFAKMFFYCQAIYICVCVYIVFFYQCSQLILFLDSEFFCLSFFESTLLNYANPSRNWTFQRFARVAEKERTQRNQ